jgi:hypothetical protein
VVGFAFAFAPASLIAFFLALWLWLSCASSALVQVPLRLSPMEISFENIPTHLVSCNAIKPFSRQPAFLSFHIGYCTVITSGNSTGGR